MVIDAASGGSGGDEWSEGVYNTVVSGGGDYKLKRSCETWR